MQLEELHARSLNDRVDEVMQKTETLMSGTRLNNNFINDVAHIYERRGYAHIENFGPYVGDEFSVCMEKPLA